MDLKIDTKIIISQIPTDDLISETIERIDGMCWCKFKDKKENLKHLKELLEKKWDMPIDPGCIE
jgi:hypothetical protein